VARPMTIGAACSPWHNRRTGPPRRARLCPAAEPMQRLAEPTMADMKPRPPILSLAERDRRWARVRGLMRERGLDGLLVAGFRAREMYETYISDDYNEGCVVFPLEGEPTVITWAHLRVMRARWSRERGSVLWVDDYRVATSGAAVAELFREKRLATSRLGVVGLASQAPT